MEPDRKIKVELDPDLHAEISRFAKRLGITADEYVARMVKHCFAATESLFPVDDLKDD